jgi:tripartite-type tricarboxylate transporter receptor subunit TctC
VVIKLQTELARIVRLPDIQARLRSLGGEPGHLTPEQFRQLNLQEYERFGKLIRQANIRVD